MVSSSILAGESFTCVGEMRVCRPEAGICSGRPRRVFQRNAVWGGFSFVLFFCVMLSLMSGMWEMTISADLHVQLLIGFSRTSLLRLNSPVYCT